MGKHKAATYINAKIRGQVETVDEFETYAEAKKMLVEYRMGFGGIDVYLSSRCTKVWTENK